MRTTPNAEGVRFRVCRTRHKKERNKGDESTMNVKEYNMDDVYKITNNASVELEVDNDVFIIRIPYLKNDAQEIIDMLDGVE